MAKQFGLPRTEKLKSRKEIERLFEKGKSFTVFPLRVTYIFRPENPAEVRIGVTVSKKYFKKAVDRNRIKRRLREAYRLQKTELKNKVQQTPYSCLVFFIYMDKTIVSFDLVKAKMLEALDRLMQKLPDEKPA